MSSLRNWATPLTIGSFLLMAVTGVLMFFHLESMLNKVVHEWAGWLMVAGVGAHLVLNWRAFTVYFRRPLAKAIMGISTVLLVVSFWPAGGGGNPVFAVMKAVEQAEIITVIELSGLDLETGLARLSELGLSADASSTLQGLTGGDHGKQRDIIAALFEG